MSADAVEARVAAGGMLSGPVVVLLSGGRDSVCLLDLAVRLAGPVVALHVNYGLRAAADADEAHCGALCARLGVPLEVVRAGEPRGNVQAWARELRYAAAAEHAGAIAAGHTATDQAETVLYRLVASPGRRALLGMAERHGRVVRPLLGVTRAQTAAYCTERGLPWVEDASNPTSTRGRIRALLELHPAAETNVARTLSLLRDEAEVLDAAVDAARERDLGELPPALARLVLQRLADEAGGPSIAAHTDALLELARHGGTAHHDLPGGLRATSVYGRVTISAATKAGAVAADDVVTLPIPGRVAFGAGEVVADGLVEDGPLEVRHWRPGDRVQTRAGTKTLQDLFTDRKVPREARHELPVVVHDGAIVWVPGVFAAERNRVRLDWRRS